MSAEYRAEPPFQLRDWDQCMRELGVGVLDGKGGMVPYDPSKPYIEETGRALRAWVVGFCCHGGKVKYRAARAGGSLRLALCRVSSILRWLRAHRWDGLAGSVERQAKELSDACPFIRHVGRDAKAREAADAKDDRAFDKVHLRLMMGANGLQNELRGIANLIGVSRTGQHVPTGERLAAGEQGAAGGTPLTDKAVAVLELLRSLPPERGMKGPEILTALDKRNPRMTFDQSTLTKRVIPELKPYGVTNRRGVGYYIDPSIRRKDATSTPS